MLVGAGPTPPPSPLFLALTPVFSCEGVNDNFGDLFHVRDIATTRARYYTRYIGRVHTYLHYSQKPLLKHSSAKRCVLRLRPAPHHMHLPPFRNLFLSSIRQRIDCQIRDATSPTKQRQEEKRAHTLIFTHPTSQPRGTEQCRVLSIPGMAEATGEETTSPTAAEPVPVPVPQARDVVYCGGSFFFFFSSCRLSGLLICVASSLANSPRCDLASVCTLPPEVSHLMFILRPSSNLRSPAWLSSSKPNLCL